jgi:hypothetical protein
MENELSELSNYVQFLSNLDELEGQVRQLVPRKMDFHHMFDTGLDYRHQNLTQATLNYPQTINFPEQNLIISESVINMVLEKFKTTNQYKFNTSKIIGWIALKMKSTIE